MQLFPSGLVVGFVFGCVWMWIGELYVWPVKAFDDPSSYARQGYHQCDSPSGWCDNEREEKPCGK